jgi:hypothetical protein
MYLKGFHIFRAGRYTGARLFSNSFFYKQIAPAVLSKKFTYQTISHFVATCQMFSKGKVI